MCKKFLRLMIVAIMMFSITGLISCENSGQEIEIDSWTLFQFGRGSSKRRQVNILSADESLVVDGILHIPAEIGNYEIHGFGTYGPPFGLESYFTVPANAERIVISAQLYVGNLFWGHDGFPDTIMTNGSSVKYVEFSCETFERVATFWSAREIIIIIPDGSTQSFLERLELLHPSDFEEINYIERSDFELNRANNNL